MPFEAGGLLRLRCSLSVLSSICGSRFVGGCHAFLVAIGCLGICLCDSFVSKDLGSSGGSSSTLVGFIVWSWLKPIKGLWSSLVASQFSVDYGDLSGFFSLRLTSFPAFSIKLSHVQGCG
eukprot:Gb_23457 [translate_table: standard]